MTQPALALARQTRPLVVARRGETWSLRGLPDGWVSRMRERGAMIGVRIEALDRLDVDFAYRVADAEVVWTERFEGRQSRLLAALPDGEELVVPAPDDLSGADAYAVSVARWRELQRERPDIEHRMRWESMVRSFSATVRAVLPGAEPTRNTTTLTRELVFSPDVDAAEPASVSPSPRT